MKTSFLVLACCLFSVFKFAELATSKVLKVEDCSKGKGIATITEFSVSPDPISLSKNVTVSMNIDVTEDIDEACKLKLRIYKIITGIFGTELKLPAPCFGGYVGNCQNEMCKYLNKFQAQSCPFFPEGVDCKCPIKAGSFGGQNVTVEMPELGPIIKLIASGYFRAEIQLMCNQKLKACFRFNGYARP